MTKKYKAKMSYKKMRTSDSENKMYSNQTKNIHSKISGGTGGGRKLSYKSY